MWGVAVGRRLSPRAGASIHIVPTFPIPAHRTGRAGFPHPALRLASHQTQRADVGPPGPQPSHAQRAEDLDWREPTRAARPHFVTPTEKVTHRAGDVAIDRLIRHRARAVVEVVRPTVKNAIEPNDDLRPRRLIPGV